MLRSSRTPMPLTALLPVEILLCCAAACHFSPASQGPSPVVVHESERRFPGVDLIRTPAGGVLIRVISGLVGPKPLYVIDGTPVEVDPKRGFDWLRPEDIAQIKVLKYPVDTMIYGPRGSDGVIVVTTGRR